ncbi:MAG: serine hydrolase domain-containing protein [Bacteroidota bacterium]
MAVESQTGGSFSQADRERIENYGAIYLHALNAGTVASYKNAIQEVFAQITLQNIGEARIMGQMDRLSKTLGELEYHHSEVVGFSIGGTLSYSLHVYGRSKNAKDWKDFQFRLEENPPYKIKDLVFIADVAEPVYLPNGTITDPHTLDWLGKYIDKLVKENDLSGSVMLARGNTPFYERYYGFADAKRSIKTTRNTRFNLGSGNKMFTAIAIAQLVEKGKLRYADPLSKFFPDFPDPEFSKKVTVHHLLSHTSGVKEYWTDEYEENRKHIDDVKQMLPWVYKVGTAFEPGSEFSYSNSNFILAGLIVEKTSQVDYYTYVRKHIYEPLGMTASDSYKRDGSESNLAAPLRKGHKGWETADHGPRGTSAGGGYSTTHDMLKFSRGLVAEKILSSEVLKMLTTSKTSGLRAEVEYGYGFELSSEGRVRSFGHGGIAGGVNSEFRYFPSEDITLIMFCNQDNGAYDDLRKNIVKLITGMR